MFQASMMCIPRNRGEARGGSLLPAAPSTCCCCSAFGRGLRNLRPGQQWRHTRPEPLPALPQPDAARREQRPAAARPEEASECGSMLGDRMGRADGGARMWRRWNPRKNSFLIKKKIFI